MNIGVIEIKPPLQKKNTSIHFQWYIGSTLCILKKQQNQMHDENIIINELTGCFRFFLFLGFSLELPYKHSCSRSYCPSVRR